MLCNGVGGETELLIGRERIRYGTPAVRGLSITHVFHGLFVGLDH